ncbi:MAG: zinc ribbon domain-containing protein [Lachnospiraceae bacterium]|nr:zinc ribbon domain-containing protein [Lachnospiraceae bacterium]
MADGVKYCRQCGKQLNIDAKFCRYCGYQFEVAQEVKAVTNLCPQCGKENAAGAKFCRDCGAGLGEAGLSGSGLAGAKAMAQRGAVQAPSAGRQNIHAAQQPGGFGGFANGLGAPTDPGEIALDIPELYEPPSSAGGSNIPGFLKLPISLAAGGISFPLLNHLEIPWSLLAGLAVSIVTIIVSSVIKKSRGGGK